MVTLIGNVSVFFLLLLGALFFATMFVPRTTCDMIWNAFHPPIAACGGRS